jgi:hypothetical protein
MIHSERIFLRAILIVGIIFVVFPSSFNFEFSRKSKKASVIPVRLLKCAGKGKLPTGHRVNFSQLNYSTPLFKTFYCLICANRQDLKR